MRLRDYQSHLQGYHRSSHSRVALEADGLLPRDPDIGSGVQVPAQEDSALTRCEGDHVVSVTPQHELFKVRQECLDVAAER